MSLFYNTGDWFTLGNGCSFRKMEMYTMGWNEISNMNVVACSFAGPIAIFKKNKSIVANAPKQVIKIFKSSGELISSIIWNEGNLVALGWSNTEELLCIQDDGIVCIYDLFGSFKHKFSMGQEAKDARIIDAKVFMALTTGVAVLTTNYRIFIVNNINEPKMRLLPSISKPVSFCWEIISEDRNTSSIISIGKEIFLSRQGESSSEIQNVSIKNNYNNIVALSASFDYQHIALYTDTGIVWGGSTDFSTKYFEVKSGRMEVPNQVVWCLSGDENLNSIALLLSFDNNLMVIGINGDITHLSFESNIALVQEIDCVRILSNNHHEIIQKVPSCTSHIFGINISEPASFLFEAHRKFNEKSHQSNEYLCLIKDNLKSAVEECIEAAGYEIYVDTQKSLLKAAYFGKSFVPAFNTQEYIKMCRIIRVLNAVRDPAIAMPLTLKQYNHLKANTLLDRLVYRKKYGVAVQIAKHLKLSDIGILEHWAFHIIKYAKNEDEVVKKISEKFLKHNIQDYKPWYRAVSFYNVAKQAEECGRKKLAEKLLQYEPKKSLQVPLLLKIGENKKALQAATQSGDTDLVYMVLLDMKNTTQLGDFQMNIRTFPLAQNLYKKYCQQHNISALKDIYSQEDDFLSQAESALREGIETNTLDQTSSTALSSFKRMNKATEADLCDEFKRLMKHQKVFSEKYAKEFYGMTLHDTMEQLIKIGDIKNAEKLKHELKMSDKRYWWIRVRAMADNFQWDELEKLSKLKKNFIGFEGFVEVCLSKNNLDEAKKYIEKCSEEKRLKLYLSGKLYNEAAKYALEQKDLQMLCNISSYFSKIDRNLTIQIEQQIEQLSNKY